MTLITFTSDFGLSDHYVAFAKAKILKHNPTAQIIDISHEVKPFDLAHMAYTIQSAFREFPESTIHLIGGNTANPAQDYIITCIEDHIFVCPDNGVVSLISERQPSWTYAIDLGKHNAFEILPQIAARLSAGEAPEQFGQAKDDIVRYTTRKARATRKEIAGHVIHVDHYGNLITNIEKTDFDILSVDRTYRIVFGRDAVAAVNAEISEVEPGEVFFIFNTNEKLMLGINQGHGAQLLGLEYDSPIIIQFEA